MTKPTSFCIALMLFLTAGSFTSSNCMATKPRGNPKGSKAAQKAERWAEKRRNAAERNHRKQILLLQEDEDLITITSDDTKSLLSFLVHNLSIPVGLAALSIVAYGKYCTGDFDNSITWIQTVAAETFEKKVSLETICSNVPELTSCSSDQIYNFYEFCCDCECNIDALGKCLPSFASIIESIKAAFENTECF